MSFGDNYWPHLSSLTLRGMDTSKEFILQFLRSHRSCLRDLQLSHMQLWNKASWLHLIPHLRNMLSLLTACIKNISTRRGDGQGGIGDWAHRVYDHSDDSKSWTIGYWVVNNDTEEKALAKYMVDGGVLPVLNNNLYGLGPD
ncbi:hypothetical protein EJ05DRAFT_86101 [Pseudovirgaria hyperparasitica]|uniref:F-box domain-containing protein n=1 Tax=Pseudovirgaria hyperparasitica TaxID=470096 RepID=A0A6A6W4N6_9PEZI|nr:uncharacterized protein EJ05DRAFT_86101 [Pseudovirgaria hyperparasitica]KAF2756011.1 hypothetical protein EJ05DRAFT_86101 [Pseudovirgaria hyperparasitica]